MVGRTKFTDSEDAHLVQYIAQNNPAPTGRLGTKLYQALEENAGNRWPWSKQHTWQSWRERYKNNQEYFNHSVRAYLKKQQQKRALDRKEKSNRQAGEAPTIKPQAVAERRPLIENMDRVVKAEKNLAREDTEIPRNVVADKPPFQSTDPQPEVVTEVNDEAMGLEEDIMLELFGSYDEEDDREDPQESQRQISSSKDIYPSLGGLPSPTLKAAEPHVPGAYRVEVPHLSQEPTPPKSDAMSRHTKSNHSYQSPAKKIKSGITDKDQTETPSTVSLPPPAKRGLPIVVEGAFRTTLKRQRASEAGEGGPVWPPKRLRQTSAAEHTKLPKQPSVHETQLSPSNPAIRPRQLQQVNAIASSSKVKLSDASKNYSNQPASIQTTLARDHATRSTSPVAIEHPIFIGNKAPAQSKVAETAKEQRKIKELPTERQPKPRQVVEKVLQTELFPSESRALISDATLPPHAPATALASIPRTGSSHTLPIKPSSDNDPFTSKVISTKAAGKAPAEPYVLENKHPPRIDLHRQSLARRPRASASFPSRPNSVISAHTSTSSNPRKPRRSDSLRRSIATLDLPEESKSFLLAAAQDITEVLENMAKKNGVSTQIAMNTYAITRNLQNTEFILNQFCQCLLDCEREIYSRLPNLRYHSSGEDDSEDVIPDGLIPQGVLRENEHAGSPRRRQGSSSPRKSNRPSLTVKPLPPPDEHVSDYSPPNTSRAGQFARLVKQGRKAEALEREKRRASGVFVINSQTPGYQHKPPLLQELSPSPQTREIVVEVGQREDDDDIYMYTDEEHHRADDGNMDDDHHEADDEDEPDQPEEEQETTASHNAAEHGSDSALANEHRMLALNVDVDNAEKMRTFEAANNPDLLRLWSIQWVNEFLEASAPGHEMESDGGVEVE